MGNKLIKHIKMSLCKIDKYSFSTSIMFLNIIITTVFGCLSIIHEKLIIACSVFGYLSLIFMFIRITPYFKNRHRINPNVEKQEVEKHANDDVGRIIEQFSVKKQNDTPNN